MEETTSEHSKKNIFIPIVIILAMIVTALMAIKASVHKEVRLNTQPIELVEGAEIPNFQLTSLDGTKKKIGDLPHKLMMINFWATWCEACMDEMPSMVALRDKYAAQGFEIISINVDENPNQTVPPILKKLKIQFPVFSDPDSALSDQFDVHAIPLTLVVNKSRKILMLESGGHEWNDDETHLLIEKWLKD